MSNQTRSALCVRRKKNIIPRHHRPPRSERATVEHRHRESPRRRVGGALPQRFGLLGGSEHVRDPPTLDLDPHPVLPRREHVDKLAENSTLGLVLAQGLRAAASEPRIAEVHLRGAFESAGRDAVHQLERNLNALGTIASAAPLLGLLGTVIGMIEIFGASGVSTGTAGANPAELAHGISVALYNTAFGLIVAIPSLMFFRHFRARVDAYTLTMEQASERMVPHLLRLTGTRR